MSLPADLVQDVEIASEMSAAKSITHGRNKAAEAVAELPRQAHIECHNMHEVFAKTEFGQKLKQYTVHKNKYYGGAKVYEVTQDIPGTILKERDLIYFDNGHKNFQSHLEVYDYKGDAKSVLWCDGIENKAAAKKAMGRKI